MADVVHKTTLVPSYKVNTPDYPTATYLINPAGLPALDAAPYVPIKYRKLITGDTDVGEMTAGEKATYDAANPDTSLVLAGDEDLLAASIASASAMVDFDMAHYFDGTYESLILRGSNLTSSIDNTRLSVRYKLDGVWIVTGYGWHIKIETSSGQTIWRDASDVSIPLVGSPATLGTGLLEAMSFILELQDPQKTSAKDHESVAWGNGADGLPGSRIVCGGGLPDGDPLQGLRVFPSSGTFSGKLALYGKKGA